MSKSSKKAESKTAKSEIFNSSQASTSGTSLQDGKPNESAPSVPAHVEVLDIQKLSERLDKATEFIRKEIATASKSFFKIGFKLYEVREKKLHLGYGYENVYDYGHELLGFQKSTIASYIAVCEKFGARNADGALTGQLNSDFSKYSYSQLALMSSIPTEKMPEIPSSATCKEMREIKKSIPKSRASSRSSKAVTVVPPSTPAPDSSPEFIGLIYSGVLTASHIDMIANDLRSYIGCEISICAEPPETSELPADESKSA